jgi:DNA-binding winged helix-turn-helix (wHTH) protein/tetratricopeptide (TPR) repeat protein
MESNHIYQFGRFHLDTAERVLLADGKAVALSPKLFDTLLALVANAGRIVEKEALLRQIWPDTFVEENSLNKNVHALRRLLGGSEGQESFIETIPKRGYRFTAKIREIGGAMLTAQRTRTSIVIEEEITDEPSLVKIAVLPFRTLDASDGAHLGLGLADTLITRLGNLSLMQVRPTAAIVKYAASDSDALAAGRELEVDAVLDGSIRRAADRVRVTVQLVSVQNAAPLWAAKFDERFTNIFAVEDAIAEQVADALLLKLTGDQRRLLTKRQTTSVAAYELYLRGLQQLNQYSATALRQALTFFHEAVRHDPEYALAYARLGGCYNLLYIYSHSVPAPQFAQQAQATAERALALDDGLAEAHAASAQVNLFCRWRAAAALAAAQRAVELKPQSTFANLALGWALSAHGEVETSVAALRRAQQEAPTAPALNVSLGHVLAFAQRYDEAAESYQQALQLVPGHADAWRGLGLVNLLRGRVEEVQAAVEAETAPQRQTIAALLRALIYARTGDAAGVRQTLTAAQALPPDAYLRSIHHAAVYAELGETDEAFDWLEHAFIEQEPMLVTLNVHPFFDKLRPTARFAALLKRVGQGH